MQEIAEWPQALTTIYLDRLRKETGDRRIFAWHLVKQNFIFKPHELVDRNVLGNRQGKECLDKKKMRLVRSITFQYWPTQPHTDKVQEDRDWAACVAAINAGLRRPEFKKGLVKSLGV